MVRKAAVARRAKPAQPDADPSGPHYTARYQPSGKSLTEFQLLHKQNELDLAPSYQRGNVWKARNESLLIDSLWRGLPIGSISMFYRKDEGIWEVVDGKQRLTTILRYLDNGFEPKPPKRGGIVPKVPATEDDDTADEAEEAVNLGDAIAHETTGKLYKGLPLRLQRAFRNIQLPVLEVNADDPREVVEIFYRMNVGLVALTSQEIRNAIYRDSAFLQEAVNVADPALAKKWVVPGAGSSWFVARSVISPSQAIRMADIQLAAELLALVHEGRPLNRRDNLDELSKRYLDGRFDADQEKKLTDAAKRLRRYVGQIDAILTNDSLKDHGLGLGAEHHLYALVGAFAAYGLNSVKVRTKRDALEEGLTKFFLAADEAIAKIRQGQTDQPTTAFAKLVQRYASQFTGGQVNGEGKRRARIEVLVVLLTLLAGTPPARNGFSRLQREQIWALFPNKQCARCKKAVTWAEFHAGHAAPKADGGPPETWNGRIEHARCNLKGGAN